MEPLLLHACCAPCSAAVVEWLMNNGARPVLFFFNPNIAPAAEYERRAAECARHAASLGLKMIEGEYDHSRWLAAVAGLEGEPERGERCARCFEVRLMATARLAGELGIRRFATTLASSRWKSLAQIADAGGRAAGVFPGTFFWDKNWRAGGLSERRRALLAEHGFYNQTFCGCEFSRRKEATS
ncbi:MAG: epoxyqueuosine reductase QueH [Odoribacteraceae bacterium]|jgi:predicted adenine nucleotide alpha hydrolase (AANH) superfamily ATPase|nr:epoxyqueuosine reductase QueH [Odoribacteraceae bacterium]